MNRKNFIDGLPASYDYNYVVKAEKNCDLCCKPVTASQIESNSIVCNETFDFFHKDCVESNGFDIVYSKPKDPTSMVRLIKRKTDELQPL